MCVVSLPCKSVYDDSMRRALITEIARPLNGNEWGEALEECATTEWWVVRQGGEWRQRGGVISVS